MLLRAERAEAHLQFKRCHRSLDRENDDRDRCCGCVPHQNVAHAKNRRAVGCIDACKVRLLHRPMGAVENGQRRFRRRDLQRSRIDGQHHGALSAQKPNLTSGRNFRNSQSMNRQSLPKLPGPAPKECLFHPIRPGIQCAGGELCFGRPSPNDRRDQRSHGFVIQGTKTYSIASCHADRRSLLQNHWFAK